MISLKQIITLFLSVAMIMTLGAGCGKSDQTDNALSGIELSGETFDVEFKPLSAGEFVANSKGIEGYIAGRTNDQLLYANPDRGYRTTISFQIIQNHPDPEDPTKTSNVCDKIIRGANGVVSSNPDSKCKHDIRYFYCNIDEESKKEIIDYLCDRIYLNYVKTDYMSKLILLQSCLVDLGTVETLPDGVFEAYDLLFDKLRSKGVKVLFRVGYHGIQLNWQVSEENKQEHLKKGATEENMIFHIKQLAPFLKKNGDILFKMSSGFIGSGGEMAYNYQYPIVNYDNVIKAIVEEICAPLGITYSVRMPEYKINLLENDPDYKYANIIGFNNDAMFGETENYGWSSGCLQYKHNFDAKLGQHKCERVDNYGTHYKNDWWNYMCENAAYTPQSGEMFHRSGTTGAGKEPTGLDIIKECAHHRYSTMSHWNSYLEDGSSMVENGITVAKDSVMQKWINDEQISLDILEENGIIGDPAWFFDNDGAEVLRNPYEFIRDHLGYKIVANKAAIEKVTKPGAEIGVKLSLNNYGFAAAFNLESGFAVLDENYNVVSSVKAGEPDKWYSHDPENWESTELLEHSVTAKLNLPTEKGKYYIAFYLKNSGNEFARLSNDPESLPFEGDGYHVLHEINL